MRCMFSYGQQVLVMACEEALHLPPWRKLKPGCTVVCLEEITLA